MCIKLFLFPETGNMRKPKEREIMWKTETFYGFMQRKRTRGCGMELFDSEEGQNFAKTMTNLQVS